MFEEPENINKMTSRKLVFFKISSSIKLDSEVVMRYNNCLLDPRTELEPRKKHTFQNAMVMFIFGMQY